MAKGMREYAERQAQHTDPSRLIPAPEHTSIKNESNNLDIKHEPLYVLASGLSKTGSGSLDSEQTYATNATQKMGLRDTEATAGKAIAHHQLRSVAFSTLKDDRYATDSENADDTTTNLSIDRVLDSQPQPNQEHAYHNDNSESSDGEEGSVGSEDDDFADEERTETVDFRGLDVEIVNARFKDMRSSMQRSARMDLWGNDTSYSSTSAEDLADVGAQNSSQEAQEQQHALPFHTQQSANSTQTQSRSPGGISQQAAQLNEQSTPGLMTKRPVQPHRGHPGQRQHARSARTQPKQLQASIIEDHSQHSQQVASRNEGDHRTSTKPQTYNPAPTSPPHQAEGREDRVLDQEEDTGVDYEPDEIKQMTYRDLLNEPFDVVPGREPFAFPHDVKEQDLAAKLQYVKTLPAENKQAFFSSLSLDQWEEAGDWFLGQFGILVDRFRDARKRKRENAQAIEEKILARHEQIEARKRKIDQAFVEMRKESDRVLPKATPKRRKQ